MPDGVEPFGESRLWSCEAPDPAPEGNQYLCWPHHRNYDPPGVPPDHPQPSWRMGPLHPAGRFNNGGSIGKYPPVTLTSFSSHSGMVETPDGVFYYRTRRKRSK